MIRKMIAWLFPLVLIGCSYKAADRPYDFNLEEYPESENYLIAQSND